MTEECENATCLFISNISKDFLYYKELLNNKLEVNCGTQLRCESDIVMLDNAQHVLTEPVNVKT